MRPSFPEPAEARDARAEAADPPDPSDIRLLPPIFVPLSDEQRRAAVDALAELFVPYVDQAREQPK